MCGIVGYLNKNGKQNPPIGRILLSMLEALACRGPDSAGMAIFGPLRPKQLVARVKLGDREESSRSAPAVEEIARKFGANEFSQAGAYLRFSLDEDGDLGRSFPMWSRLPR